MMDLPPTPEEWAQMLNELASAALEAIRSDDTQKRQATASGLREIRLLMDDMPEIAAFIDVLARWIEGEPPTRAVIQRLEVPYRRAVSAMLEDARQAPGAAPQEPISRRVLGQLVAAVVIARMSDDEAVQRKLAAQLVTIQGQLDREWRKRLRPLLENLRAVLGGTDPLSLPLPDDPLYQQLWLNARELLLARELGDEAAKAQLLDRLVHNATFVLKANSPELTEALVRSLLDVQRQALDTQALGIATLVGTIRAHLQGLDATPLATLLEGEELAAWQRILEETEATP
jgi:hypothetical protein